MKRVFALAALAVVLVLVGALLRWTVFLDVEKFRDDLGWQAVVGAREELYPEMARRTHRGAGPCLRYLDRTAIVKEELVRTADDAEAAGVAEQVIPLFPLFLRWADEADAPHHATDEAEELLWATREHVRGVDRLVLALNYRRVLRSTRARDQATRSRLVGEAERRAAAAAPGVREKLHALWGRHRLALSIGGVVRLAPELKRRVTVARMDRIAEAAQKWRAGHGGTLPDRLADLHLPPDDLKDGWSREIQYQRVGDGAQLTSDPPGESRVERALR